MLRRTRQTIPTAPPVPAARDERTLIAYHLEIGSIMRSENWSHTTPETEIVRGQYQEIFAMGACRIFHSKDPGEIYPYTCLLSSPLDDKLRWLTFPDEMRLESFFRNNFVSCCIGTGHKRLPN
ncbi:MAG TPA: hypothetical protein VGL94_18100 [Ktedonobacteraceae bacterium]|jgi:hypothetical protein